MVLSPLSIHRWSCGRRCQWWGDARTEQDSKAGGAGVRSGMGQVRAARSLALRVSCGADTKKVLVVRLLCSLYAHTAHALRGGARRTAEAAQAAGASSLFSPVSASRSSSRCAHSLTTYGSRLPPGAPQCHLARYRLPGPLESRAVRSCRGACGAAAPSFFTAVDVWGLGRGGGRGRVGSSTAAALVASGTDVEIYLAGRNRCGAHPPALSTVGSV
jgi:hypothetical protein